MKHLLLVDDEARDLIKALEVAESLGIEDIHAKNSIRAAREHLDKGLKGEVSLPDAIVLDLDLGVESGFELMRMWHSTPGLARIPLMVWSVVDEHRDVCDLFNVTSFVSKWQGIGAFRDALARLVS